MKMTLRNLCVELWPKMRLGSMTLILRPKSKVCNGSTLANPLLRNLRELLQQGRWWRLSFGIVKVLSWWITLRKVAQWCVLCRRIKAAVSGDCITKTCLYNFDPLKPHFYIVKLGFTGVYIIFLISAQKHRCFKQKYEKYSRFLSENFQFLEVKSSIYLNRLVFIMKREKRGKLTQGVLLLQDNAAVFVEK